MRAANFLRECQNVEKMHFIIAQTMMKYQDMEVGSLYARAQHVSQACSVIQARVLDRRRYRDLLSDAAGRAIESGARSTALQYYEVSLSLLQSNPWATGARDVDYHETLRLHATAAELYWHQGQSAESQKLLDRIFAHAHEGSQKAHAWIIQSKLLGQSGNLTGALTALRTSLFELGLQFSTEPTWEVCDDEYCKLKEEFQRKGVREFIRRPLSSDPAVSSMGAVMLEAISAAFWSDSLLVGPCELLNRHLVTLTLLAQLYQMCIKAAKALLTYTKTFPQIGLALAYLSTICIGRHGDIDYALQIHDASTELLNLYGDSYTIGRGLALSGLFVAHLREPLKDTADLFYSAIDNALLSGDKHQMFLSVGGVAALKLYSGDHLGEIESYCANAPEDFGNWAQDLRGGTTIIGCRYEFFMS